MRARAAQAAKKAAARRAAARKAAARPKPRAKPRSQPKPRPKPRQVKRAVKKVAKEVREEAQKTAKDEAQGAACESAAGMANSFVPGTQVLMADGSTKPIEKVRPGDKVVATDPKTGKTSVQTAAATIVGKGSMDLVRITLKIHDGSTAKTATTTVTATAGHPFWFRPCGSGSTRANSNPASGSRRPRAPGFRSVRSRRGLRRRRRFTT